MLFAVTSCGLTDGKSGLDFSVRVDEAVRAEEVTFEVLRKKVLPSCIGCHQKWTSADAFAKYIVPGKPEESQLFDSVKAGRMPKNSPALSSAQLEIVRNYIANMKVIEPVPVPMPVPETQPEAVTFSELQEKVFSVSCLPCHAKILNDEPVLIEKWVNKESPELSKLLVETESGRMPKRGAPLSEEQLTLIRNYVNSFRD